MPASVTEDLGIQGIVAEIFAPEFILPGPGQGTRAVVGRANDHEARDLLSDLHSRASADELTAEHAFCRRMISDQDLPVGALARVRGKHISIVGSTGSGSNRITVKGGRGDADKVGDGLATRMLCTVDTFADLLEADFPDGLPDDDDSDDLALVDADNKGDGESEEVTDLDDLEHLRDLEDMAGIEPPKEQPDEFEEED